MKYANLHRSAPLGRARAPLSLKDIVLELGYPTSSAHGLLATLVIKGYAARDAADRYQLNAAYRNGPEWASGPDAELIAFAEPVMRDLRHQCGETVMLGILNQDLMLKVIAMCVANRAVRYDSPFSGGVSSFCSAMGRVLLAAKDEKTVGKYLAGERLVKFTPATVTDKAHFKKILREVGKQGFAISNQEMDLGSTGIAVPIYDRAGKVVAALDVAAISSRHEDGGKALVPLVTAFARDISRKLGHMDRE